MQSFQQLLVTPADQGLLADVVDDPPELHIAGVSDLRSADLYRLFDHFKLLQ
ncbi:hypothetical protein [Synechococcus sp. BIOS-E4-1]|uniref:hypothetical protein n=1 Tax=Synechococcus sp. BIOS-E4-1 TaxID=1400864 RepID=UPI001645D718|nr:hypothetical protein [Synechococcus sp. BIOS-E4-1]